METAKLTDQEAAEKDAAQDDIAAENELESTAAGQELAGEGASDDLEALQAKAQAHWNQYLRTAAELENLRKRSARDVENARKFGVERLIAAILPVRDSLEAALKAASDADPSSFELETILEGERATLRLLDQALEAVGVDEIDPDGQPFDPEHHEAMSMLPSATAEPNSVLAVVQKGYALHGRVVRPARVVVAQAPVEPQEN